MTNENIFKRVNLKISKTFESLDDHAKGMNVINNLNLRLVVITSGFVGNHWWQVFSEINSAPLDEVKTIKELLEESGFKVEAVK